VGVYKSSALRFESSSLELSVSLAARVCVCVCVCVCVYKSSLCTLLLNGLSYVQIILLPTNRCPSPTLSDYPTPQCTTFRWRTSYRTPCVCACLCLFMCVCMCVTVCMCVCARARTQYGVLDSVIKDIWSRKSHILTTRPHWYPPPDHNDKLSV
jgi:hypothetical protein